jgi:imidazolonepropionase-like amidohydrolase
MRHNRIRTHITYFLKLSTALLLWNAGHATGAPMADTATLFTHVNVVPMDRERVLSNQSVLVEDGRIKDIGAKLSAPAGAREIDGHGTEFLSPGLADMHVHSDTSRDMAVFLANGITTVLNMGEARNSFMAQTRPKVNSGEIPGPHIYAGFLVDGSPEFGHLFVTTPPEARAFVDLAKTNGYDFIKVYNNLSPECFMALIEQGKADGLPVIGHGVTKVGLARQLAAGQLMVAHLEEYLYTVFFKAASDPGNRAPELSQIKAAVELTQRAHAFVTADLNTYATIAKQWGKPDVVDAFLRMPEIRYLDPDDRILWRSSSYAHRHGDLSHRLAFLKVFCKALADTGVPLLTGTDTPSIPGLVPGYSLHQDLHALEEAGLNRYQVLSAATREPGELIARAKKSAPTFGTLTAGERADLILSAANPLDDLATLEKPLGVMANGHWYDRSALQSLLNEVATKYETAAEPP